MAYTVKSVADLASVTVRALHHYDRIGLLRPESVSEAGYRLYSDADLEKLQQVLFFRELGFGLREIKRIMDSPRFDRREALLEHRRLLLAKKSRVEALIHSVDRTLESLDGGKAMEKKEMFGGLDDSTLEQYRDEARARWGDVVDESYRRLERCSKEEQQAIWAEAQQVTSGIAALMDRDLADAEVQELVGRRHRLIDGRYWSCSPEAFRAMGDMYVEDERFTQFCDRVRPGLAAFLRSAMHVYCDGLAATR